jgi:hypothetical protein
VAENERDRIRERARDVKRHRASQRLFNGGKRPFGFDIKGEGKDRRLVPNATEQAALARGKALQAEGKNLCVTSRRRGRPSSASRRSMPRA